MARITIQELHYNFSRVLERRLRSLKVPSPKAAAEELAPLLINEVPGQAFDPAEPWSEGNLIFHEHVDETSVIEMQYQILGVHHNLPPEKELTLHLSSFGGGCYEGLALIGTIQHIRRQGRKVNAHVSGYAMSMGSLILQACDKRTIDADGWLMIHEVAYWQRGKTSAHEEELENVKRLQDGMYAMYSRRSGRPIEHYRKRLHKTDVYLTAQQALEEGLVDEVALTPAFKRFRKKAA